MTLEQAACIVAEIQNESHRLKLIAHFVQFFGMEDSDKRIFTFLKMCGINATELYSDRLKIWELLQVSPYSEDINSLADLADFIDDED